MDVISYNTVRNVGPENIPQTTTPPPLAAAAAAAGAVHTRLDESMFYISDNLIQTSGS